MGPITMATTTVGQNYCGCCCYQISVKLTEEYSLSSNQVKLSKYEYSLTCNQNSISVEQHMQLFIKPHFS